ncbi:M48 family metallopeptidase [Candidatus Izemoplasma sp. B36]|uniref:M48 family metallopeptidase n=1 Tax=Candidatus Izemoplasma sp. B36 TaxID=3242468 RepID=UPI003555F34C
MNKIKLGNKFFYYQVFYKNNKNMYLRIKKDMLVITCNRFVSINQIEAFILKNEANILKKIAINSNINPLYNESVMDIFGKAYQIKCNYNSKKNNYSLNENTIYIDFRKDSFDEKYIEKIYKEFTLKKINETYHDIYDYISEYLNINHITFKTQLMKSRFGSCIPKKRIIKLNSILSRFDDKYIKVILIHELIHLQVHNHQKDFYKYINLLIPNYKQHIKELNNLNRKYVI